MPANLIKNYESAKSRVVGVVGLVRLVGMVRLIVDHCNNKNYSGVMFHCSFSVI